jgi:hypothetical protein
VRVRVSPLQTGDDVLQSVGFGGGEFTRHGQKLEARQPKRNSVRAQAGEFVPPVVKLKGISPRRKVAPRRLSRRG